MEDDQSIIDALEQLKSRMRMEDKLAGVVLAASPPPELLPFGKLTPEMLTHQFRVNVAGPQLLLSGLIKNHFRQDKSGVVVGVLSAATGSSERPPATGMGAYVIAKTAMRGMLDVCAAEYPWLRVHTVSPGFTETPMLKVFDERYLEQMRAKGSFSTSEEVARMILRELAA
jgi:NAD(P)-dependent dehydrogenase (short-subunit alcohol dehydrogenase family)